MPQAECGFNDISGGVTGSQLLVFHGPTILVDIGFDPTYTGSPGPPPVAGLKGIRALIDTGAGESCIDSVVASQLNLPIVDKRMTSGAHGSAEVNMHLAQIHVPSVNFTIYGMFAAVHLQVGGQSHQALIGRTFLMRCKMIYDGPTGAVTLSTP